MTEGRWITEQDLVEAIDLHDAIEAVEGALRLEAAGQAVNMDKTHAAWGDGHTLHAIGAALAGAGVVGTKTWAHTAGGATPLVVLWKSDTGALVAIVEAFALGQLRTAAMTAVATRYLARPGAGVLGLVGTGKQALAQVAAVAAVRPLRCVRVHSPTAAHRTAFVDRLRAEGFAFEVCEAPTVAAALEGADVVVTATRAKEPFVTSAMLQPGVHVNAVGAITPERGEISPDVVDRCAVVAVDGIGAARRLATELAAVEPLVALSALVGAGLGRPPGADLTLFKAMGVGLADLAVAITVNERVGTRGGGRPIPQPVPARPVLRRTL